MTRWRLAILALLAGAGLFLLIQSARRTTSVHATPAPGPATITSDRSQNPKLRVASANAKGNYASPDNADQAILTEATSATPATTLAPAATPPVPETAESSSLPPLTILQNMRTTIVQYGSTFGENPVGNNFEITKALQGDNPKQINFLKDDGNRVNANGELVDPWGTPYFFHQISGHEMEIRSAGPDRVMYTKDDLVTR